MKRNQKASLIILLLVTVLAYAFPFLLNGSTTAFADSLYINGSDIIQQVEGCGGTLEEIRIDGWVKMNCEYMSLDDLQKQIVGLLPLLGENSESEIHTGEIEDTRQVSLTLDQNGIQTNINFFNSGFSHDKADSWDTYIIINSILDSNCIQKESQIYEEIEELLSQFGSDPSVSTTYTAVITDKLSTGKMEQLAKGFIQKLQGRITESNKDSDWVSFTAYSNRLGGGLESEYGRFNVNIALRYHSSEGKTYIRVGTPVIAIPH